MAVSILSIQSPCGCGALGINQSSADPEELFPQVGRTEQQRQLIESMGISPFLACDQLLPGTCLNHNKFPWSYLSKFLGDPGCEPTWQSCVVGMAWSPDFTNKLCYRLKTLGAPKATEK